MKKSTKWGLRIIICVVLIMFISILLESEEQKAAKQQEKEKPSKIEQKIKAISDNETIAKFISISKIEDDGSMYRIWITLLFDPRSYDEVQTWTDVVCKSSKLILDNNGVVRNISVWAIRAVRFEGRVGAIFYGRTFYDHHTDKFEFKNREELKSKEEKKAVSLLE